MKNLFLAYVRWTVRSMPNTTESEKAARRSRACNLLILLPLCLFSILGFGLITMYWMWLISQFGLDGAIFLFSIYGSLMLFAQYHLTKLTFRVFTGKIDAYTNFLNSLERLREENKVLPGDEAAFAWANKHNIAADRTAIRLMFADAVKMSLKNEDQEVVVK